MDGYFPSELRGLHPEGLVFEVADQTATIFSAVPAAVTLASAPAAGGAAKGGSALSGATSSAPLPQSDALRSLGQVGGKMLRLSELVASLPKTVVTETGSIVHVRENVANLVPPQTASHGPFGSGSVLPVAALSSLAVAGAEPGVSTDGGAAKFASIQVRTASSFFVSKRRVPWSTMMPFSPNE